MRPSVGGEVAPSGEEDEEAVDEWIGKRIDKYEWVEADSASKPRSRFSQRGLAQESCDARCFLSSESDADERGSNW